MKRRIALVGLTVLALSIMVTMFAIAGPLLSVQIAVRTNLNTPVTCPDPFQAFGPAVTTGFLCGTGEVYADPYAWPPPPSGVTIIKRFTCADGSGAFAVALTVWLGPNGATRGLWHVFEGTRSYSDLIGSGSLSGSYDPYTNTVLDIYKGRIGILGRPCMVPPLHPGK